MKLFKTLTTLVATTATIGLLAAPAAYAERGRGDHNRGGEFVRRTGFVERVCGAANVERGVRAHSVVSQNAFAAQRFGQVVKLAFQNTAQGFSWNGVFIG